MTPVAAQVLQLALGVGIVLSLVRALAPRGAATEGAHARRRAEWLSVHAGLVVTYLGLVVLRALTGPDGVDPLGLVPFLTLAAVVPVAALVLRWAWRTAVHTGGAGRRHGGPADPEPPRGHRGLGGEEVPPVRW